MKKRVVVDTSDYEVAHGRHPDGLGIWVAAVRAEGLGEVSLEYTGRWGQARRHFEREARRLGGPDAKVWIRP